MKKTRYIPILLTLTFLLSACGKEAAEVPELKVPVSVEFDTAFVSKGDICNYRYYDAKIIPVTMEIKSEEGGLLKEVLVNVGDHVNAGDIIARYNDEDAKARLESLDAEIEYNRKKSICENEIAAERASVSGSELDKLLLKQQKETQALEMQILNEKRAEVLNEIGECDIVAPESGNVVYVANAGYINKDGFIAITADEEKVLARSEFINDQIISRSDKITIFHNGEETDVTPRPYERSDYVAATLRGGTFYTYYDIEKKTDSMKAGDYAQLIIRYNSKNDVLKVPNTTLSMDSDGYYVYKQENGTRVKCRVAVGVKNELEAEVLDGLSEGDEIYVKN